MNIILDVFKESVSLLNEMSAYLVFGFLFAGVLHVFIREDTISSHLGKNNFMSVIKASLFGIPLPLCSCGVLPAALSLKKGGASKGSVVSFLITTPTTGVDSIMATYGLLGWVFTVFRIVATFIIGMVAGVVTNIFSEKAESPISREKNDSCKACCGNHSVGNHTFVEKIIGALRYAFFDLLEDVGPWLLFGVLVGGAIGYFVPDTFVETHMGSIWQSMFIMLAVGTPMYVCASGSLPIAAALMLKGLNPGAAFVFLLVGPATNAAAITVIAKELGAKTTVIFLGSIIVCSLGLGLLLNYIWELFNINTSIHLMGHQELIPSWIKLGASILLLSGIVFNIFSKRTKKHH